MKITRPEGFVTLRFPTVTGQIYPMEAAGRPDEKGTWTNVGTEMVGDGSEEELTVPRTEDRRFFRVFVSAVP